MFSLYTFSVITKQVAVLTHEIVNLFNLSLIRTPPDCKVFLYSDAQDMPNFIDYRIIFYLSALTIFSAVGILRFQGSTSSAAQLAKRGLLNISSRA
jgi:hypothetical protein